MSRNPRRAAVVGLAAALAAAAVILTPASALQPPASPEPPADVVAATYREVAGQKTVTLDQLDQLGPPPWLSLTEESDPAVVAAWADLATRLDPSTFDPATELPPATTEPPATTVPPSTTEPPATTVPPPGDAEVIKTESEPAGQTGLNDTAGTGEAIDGFGTGDGDLGQARIFGNLIDPPPPDLPPLGGSSVEDDGAIPLANPTGLVADTPLLFTGVIGDGPFGATSGDFDHYALGTIEAGQAITVDTESAGLDVPVDTAVALYDSTGALLAFNDDDGASFDSFIEIEAPATDDYFVAVLGFGTFQTDPFDSGSGEGAFVTGDYQLILSFGAGRPAGVEDDGSIPLANPTGLAPDSSVRFTGFVGDGPFGASSGDFDFYALGTAEAGTFIRIDITSTDLLLDSIVALYDSTGTLVGFNDDDGVLLDSLLVTAVPATGEYFALVGGFGPGLPADPFDSASGAGAGATGSYQVELEHSTDPIVDSDVDVFLVDLAAGDAVSVGLIGAASEVSIVDPSGVQAQRSFSNMSWLYPASSPLRHTGDVGAEHVAADAGMHAVVIEGFGGGYQGEIRVARAGRRDGAAGEQQILFLDFDGAELDTTIFGPGLGTAHATVTPMASFLWRWGLSPGDEDAVIDAVVATVEENLSADLRVAGKNGDRDASGIPGELDIEIRNSRDHADPWGEPNVSRIIVGGTVLEAAIGTIGIAQSIDPGNFDSTETALVLLDALSGAAGTAPTLNDFGVDPSASRVDLVGVGVGNVVAHEAGHLFGNWHTETFNEVLSIMDAGGDLAGTVGVGADLTFGTADDVDVDLVVDAFFTAEGFTGSEDTTNRTAFGLSTGEGPPG
jgi:hypothetical protein